MNEKHVLVEWGVGVGGAKSGSPVDLLSKGTMTEPENGGDYIFEFSPLFQPSL